MLVNPATLMSCSPRGALRCALRNTDLKTYFGDLHMSMHTLFRSVSGGWDHRRGSEKKVAMKVGSDEW